METRYAYKCIAPHLKNLRLCGYYQIDPQSPKRSVLFNKIYMRIGYIWICTYTLQQVIKMFEVRNDMDEVMATLFLFLTHTASIYKQTVFWRKADQIEEFLEILKGPLYNKYEHKKYLITTAQQSKLLLRIVNIVALITCFMWIVIPVIRHLQGELVDVPIWLPFDYNSDRTFYIVMAYVWISTSSLAFGNTTMDVTISYLFAQCQIQTRILKIELSNVVKRSKEEASISKSSFEQILIRRFKNILDHYNEIIRYSKMVEDVFSGALLYLFLITGWVVCTSLYRLVDLKPTSVQFLSMASYLFCVLVETFIYCFFGSEATFESKKLTEYIYCMDWLDTPVIHRKNMILLMERAKRPIEPMAGNLIPLSNETFLRIMKSSYSFFTLLRATK